MRIVAVGIGGAGSRVVDALCADNESRQTQYLTGVRALDTDRQELSELESVPETARKLFGQVRTNGAGTGGDQSLAVAAIEDDLLEVRRTVDSAIGSDAAAIFLITGLGGGTGNVVTPKLAEALQEIYERPVYAITILPAGHEEVPAEKASRGLQALDSVVDAQIVFDNDAWLNSGTAVENATEETNQVLVERLGALFAAGEAHTSDSVGQRVVDASEIISTLNEGGLATLGFAKQSLRDDDEHKNQSLVERLRSLVSSTDKSVDEVESIKLVESTLRQAAKGRLTLDCPLDAAASGLLVVSGPPEWLHQSAVSDGQSWLSDQIESAQLRTGDNPIPDGTELSILVLLGGVRDTPRISNLLTGDI